VQRLGWSEFDEENLVERIWRTDLGVRFGRTIQKHNWASEIGETE